MVRAQDDEDGAVSSEFQTGVLSAYVSEGRENFDGSPVIESCAVVAWQSVCLEVGNVTAFDNDGVEWTAGAAVEAEWAGMAWAAGYTHIWEDFDGEACEDDELWLAVDMFSSESWNVCLESVYSFEADGLYWIAGVSWTVPTPDTFEVALFGAVSWDDGYALEDFSGSDHVELGVEVVLPLTTHSQLAGFVAGSWGLDGVRADTNRDLFFGGVSYALEF